MLNNRVFCALSATILSFKSARDTHFREYACYQLANHHLFDEDIRTVLKTGDYRYALDRFDPEPNYKIKLFAKRLFYHNY